MYKVAKIKLIPILEDKEASIDSLVNLMGCLYKNDQILDEYVVEDHENYYMATVTTTDDDSLNECYYNEYIQREIKNFKVSYEIVADDAFCEDSCHCEDPSYYIVDCDSEESTNPVFCGDCGCEVPLYKIPYIDDEKEHYTIQEYRRLYNSVYRVWLHGLSDRFSRRELIHYKSKLNKEGSRICKELEEKLGKPVYFLIINPLACYYQYKKNSKNLKVCPKCKGKFRFIEDGYADKVCDKCRYAFLHYDEIKKKDK